MNEADALDIVQSAVWTIVAGAGPAVAAAMVVGIVIALFQALTQIQEVTLTFVPKILAIFVVIALTASFTGGAGLCLHPGELRAHPERLSLNAITESPVWVSSAEGGAAPARSNLRLRGNERRDPARLRFRGDRRATVSAAERCMKVAPCPSRRSEP